MHRVFQRRLAYLPTGTAHVAGGNLAVAASFCQIESLADRHIVDPRVFRAISTVAVAEQIDPRTAR